MTKAVLAAVDWGTSSFRLWLLDASGSIVAERRGSEGMLVAATEGFSAVLERYLADAGAPGDLRVIVCGMAGARQGWLEAPYVKVPANLRAILEGAVSVPGLSRQVEILPGLSQTDEETPDVMRGEETQLAGISPLIGKGRHLVCMPGTHSKWVQTTDGSIERFRTWLTGELFALLATQSILRHSIGNVTVSSQPDNPFFIAACRQALGGGGDISSSLFRIRAATLLQDLQPADAAATLSGLLIGAEIASALRTFARPAVGIVLVGSGPLGLLYAHALKLAGCSVVHADAEEAVRIGLYEAARHLGWVERAA